MNPLFLRWLPYAIIALLAIALLTMTNMYFGKRDELAAFKGQVAVLAAAAEAQAKAKNAEQAKNLERVKADYETKISTIRSGANAAYRDHIKRLRNANTGGRGLPRATQSDKVDDGTECEQVPDSTFVENAAEDAAKLTAWQEKCLLDGCPIDTED